MINLYSFVNTLITGIIIMSSQGFLHDLQFQNTNTYVTYMISISHNVYIHHR